MNNSHNISATLFRAFWRLKEQFETHVNLDIFVFIAGTDKVMWKTALSSVLPIGNNLVGFLVISHIGMLSSM